ncbi:hypothetical protein [Streptomyces virginiae]|uniref:hypothetical protein n=1 Tax=Streptomyces virginiae TaxID=1961 RepID=UPI00224F260A|nr:hypothetical protein [Streptomyces virginiae]MCX4958390.1 hypothetical protein [Streptomyces virginiae]MCX5177216.1 hypothetical protein [Streptomyces virginiae]
MPEPTTMSLPREPCRRRAFHAWRPTDRDGYRATPVEEELITRLITGWTDAGAAAPG